MDCNELKKYIKFLILIGVEYSLGKLYLGIVYIYSLFWFFLRVKEIDDFSTLVCSVNRAH